MKKFLKIYFPALLLVAVLFSLISIPVSAGAVSLNKSCVMNLKSGWNLVSLAELTCGLMRIDSGGSDDRAAINFPAYLDIYAYDGSEYIHARINKKEVENGGIGGASLESAIERYANKIVKKMSSNQSDDFNNFEGDMERDILQNNTQKIKEYTGRLTKEIFTSVWVYNPGQNFTLEHFPKYEDDAIGVLMVRALATDVSSSDLSELANFIEDEIAPGLLEEIYREEGYSSFVREISSGKLILDTGWNFLSYSRFLSDDSGNFSFNGNCTITKAYVFDDSSKRWVNAESVGRGMIGSGMVVYNSGGKCNLTPSNSILGRLKSILSNGPGSGISPPSFPN